MSDLTRQLNGYIRTLDDTPVCLSCPWRARHLLNERHAYPRAECGMADDKLACDDVTYPSTNPSAVRDLCPDCLTAPDPAGVCRCDLEQTHG